MREITVFVNFSPQLVILKNVYLLHTIQTNVFDLYVSILMRTINEYFCDAEKYQDQVIKFNKIIRFSKISLYTSNNGVCKDLIMPKMLLDTLGRSPSTCQRQTELCMVKMVGEMQES